MLIAYLVRQDGKDFYCYDGSALDCVISYIHQVRDFDMTQAQQARAWFKRLAAKWGWSIRFEGE
jgi:hypothetical protein